MIEILPTDLLHIENLVRDIKREQYEFYEYKFLTDNQLVEYFFENSKKTLDNSNAFSLTAFESRRLVGYLSCVMDEFDSDIFGFPCYRISNLITLTSDFSETKAIVHSLISTLEKLIENKKLSTYYFAYSLNNNLTKVDQIFNSITNSGFHYIHTLLTFSSNKQTFETKKFYPEENIHIRAAKPEDANEVANLAQKSFRFSRFHLDPFLDNEKASFLLKTSAENSIKKKFVDIMFVAERNGSIIGYYSAKKKFIPAFSKTMGNVVISAVDSENRGMGVFSKMDSHILNWFSENTDFAEMGTYLANYPVHKTWINKGLGLIRGTHQFSKLIQHNNH
jgi:hypothetical protein